MKVAIVGSRTYQNLQRVKDFVNSLVPEATVVSGGAKGVDTYAEQCAKQRGLQVISLPPENADIALFGFREAAMRRNEEIVNQSDLVVAFWRKNSGGTANTVCHAVTQHKRVMVVLDD